MVPLNVLIQRQFELRLIVLFTFRHHETKVTSCKKVTWQDMVHPSAAASSFCSKNIHYFDALISCPNITFARIFFFQFSSSVTRKSNIPNLLWAVCPPTVPCRWVAEWKDCTVFRCNNSPCWPAVRMGTTINPGFSLSRKCLKQWFPSEHIKYTHVHTVIYHM